MLKQQQPHLPINPPMAFVLVCSSLIKLMFSGIRMFMFLELIILVVLVAVVVIAMRPPRR